MSGDCPQTDAVLARFLDGDPAPGDHEALSAHDHLLGCGPCRTALRRARRLDAVLAGMVTARPSPEQTERLLASVGGRGFGAARGAAAPRRHPTALLVGLLAMLCGAVLVPGLWEPVRPDADPPDPPPRRGAAPAPGAWKAPVAGVRLPDLVPGSRPLRRPLWPAGARRDQTRIARLLLLRPSLHLACAAAAVAGGVLGMPPAPTGPLAVSWAAARTLAGAADPPTRAVLIRTLAEAPPSVGLAVLVRVVRRSSGAVADIERALARRPEDEGSLRAAARVGTARLDARLRRLGVGSIPDAERVAAALASLPVRPGRAGLLLSIWADLSARGFDRASPSRCGARGARFPSLQDRARHWFSRLGRTDTRELIALALATRNAERRDRCFTALAARGDREATAFLIERVRRGGSDEAVAAAFALGSCPRAAPAILRALDRGRRRHLLQAALASLRPDLIRAHLPGGLSDRERDLLQRGRLSRHEIARAGAILRRGGPRTE